MIADHCKNHKASIGTRSGEYGIKYLAVCGRGRLYTSEPWNTAIDLKESEVESG